MADMGRSKIIALKVHIVVTYKKGSSQRCLIGNNTR